MSNIPKLSASEVSSRMGRMSPRQATSFYNRCMVNPDTPQENILLLRQYREQNPDRFLSDEQMRSSRGSTGFGSRKGGWFREKGNHVIDGDGFSYDRDGNRYDAYGNADTGFRDGGSGWSFRGNGNPNGFSSYYGAANQGSPNRYRNDGNPNSGSNGNRRPISEARSYEELGQTLMSLGSDVRRTRYFMKVANNPDTNPETLNNLVRFRNNNPSIFASDETAKEAGPQMQGRRRGIFSNLWKSEDEFKSMAPKKQKFFVRAFRNRNRARNTAYGLRVMTNPTTSQDDKVAMAEVVNENPGLFFKGRSGVVTTADEGRS